MLTANRKAGNRNEIKTIRSYGTPLVTNDGVTIAKAAAISVGNEEVGEMIADAIEKMTLNSRMTRKEWLLQH